MSPSCHESFISRSPARIIIRFMGLQVNVNNLFNTIQWMSIDTDLNSLTFGQVTRFAPLRTITLNLRYRF